MLREDLDRITDDPDCSRHPHLINALEGHAIRVLESSRPLARYTCFMHVVGLYDQEAYVEVAISGDGSIFANSTFIAYLIEQGVLSEKPTAERGDIVLYFRDGSPTHAGIAIGDGRLISKWGIGHLYEHDVYEVPAKYGQEIRYYHRLAPEASLEHFLEFAAQQGAFG